MLSMLGLPVSNLRSIWPTKRRNNPRTTWDSLPGEHLQLRRNLPDRLFPSLRLGLAKQPHRRIPGRIGAIEQPAEIRGEGEQQPCRLAHRAREMRDGGIDADDQIERTDESRRVGEVLKLVRPVEQAHSRRRRLSLGGGGAFLQAEEIDAINLPERG